MDSSNAISVTAVLADTSRRGRDAIGGAAEADVNRFAAAKSAFQGCRVAISKHTAGIPGQIWIAFLRVYELIALFNTRFP
jgi:hypothetical protein